MFMEYFESSIPLNNRELEDADSDARCGRSSVGLV